MPPGGPSAPLVRSRRTNSHISRSPCDNHKVLTVWLWSMRHISSNHDGQICTINDKPDHSVCEVKECSWFVESYGILQEEAECLCLNFHQWWSVNLICICTLRVCMHVKKESCSMFHSSQGRKSLNILQEYSLGRVIWNTTCIITAMARFICSCWYFQCWSQKRLKA